MNILYVLIWKSIFHKMNSTNYTPIIKKIRQISIWNVVSYSWYVDTLKTIEMLQICIICIQTLANTFKYKFAESCFLKFRVSLNNVDISLVQTLHIFILFQYSNIFNERKCFLKSFLFSKYISLFIVFINNHKWHILYVILNNKCN